MERDPNMLRNLLDICKVLGIGRRRFLRYFKEASPPMPVQFDGFSTFQVKLNLVPTLLIMNCSGIALAKAWIDFQPVQCMGII